MGQFNLRWNNHITNILQVFLEHLSSESLVDVTLSCEGRFIKAHKIILSACSPYFQELFQSHKSKHPVIILNGVKYEDLQSMIQFMYNGEIRVEESELTDLLATAESLQVKGLCNVRDGKNDDNDKEEKNDSQLKEEEPNFETDGRTSQVDINGDVEPDCSEDKEKNRPKKRRKMSHTVNQLANETTFTTTKTLRLDPAVQPPSPPESPYSQPPKIIEETPKKLKIKAKAKHDRQTIICGENGPEKIRRPPNAFMIFANEWRRRLATEHPKESNTEISVRLGVMWKGLSNEIKDSYYALAKKVDEEHKKKYPGYYYSPKEARMRKNLKQDLMLSRCLPPKDYFDDSIQLSQVYTNRSDQIDESHRKMLFRDIQANENVNYA